MLKPPWPPSCNGIPLHSLPSALQVMIQEQGECGHLAHPGLVQHCLRHWLTMGLDVVLPIPQLLQTVDQAVEQLFAQQRVPLPPRDASGAFIAADGSGGSDRKDGSDEGGSNTPPSSSSSSSTMADCAAQRPSSAAGQALWLVPPLCLLLAIGAVLRRPPRPHRHGL